MIINLRPRPVRPSRPPPHPRPTPQKKKHHSAPVSRRAHQRCKTPCKMSSETKTSLFVSRRFKGTRRGGGDRAGPRGASRRGLAAAAAARVDRASPKESASPASPARTAGPSSLLGHVPHGGVATPPPRPSPLASANDDRRSAGCARKKTRKKNSKKKQTQQKRRDAYYPPRRRRRHSFVFRTPESDQSPSAPPSSPPPPETTRPFSEVPLHATRISLSFSFNQHEMVSSLCCLFASKSVFVLLASMKFCSFDFVTLRLGFNRLSWMFHLTDFNFQMFFKLILCFLVFEHGSLNSNKKMVTD